MCLTCIYEFNAVISFPHLQIFVYHIVMQHWEGEQFDTYACSNSKFII
jgi:hypothetical protein